MGDLLPDFRELEKEEGQSVLALGVSQVTLIQNNQYATLSHFGVTCPESYHLQITDTI